MEKQGIILFSCGLFENKLLKSLAVDVAQEFRAPVQHRESALDIHQYYNPGRRQYDANGLLTLISRNGPKDGTNTTVWNLITTCGLNGFARSPCMSWGTASD